MLQTISPAGMLRRRAGLPGLALCALLSALGPAQERPVAVNDVCPVMPEEGALEDMDILVEYEGATIALCCKRCKKEWLKDPEPYVAWLRDNGYLTGPVEPVDGGALDAAPDPGALPAEVGYPPPGPSAAVEAVEPAPAKSERAPDPWVDTALDRLGRFHPLVAHFPVALLLGALLAQGLGAWRGRGEYEVASRFCLAFGAIGAIAAALLGWASAAASGYPSGLQRDLFLHRWIGTVTAALAALAWSTVDRARPLHRCLLVLAALGVAVAGYFGANLIYGPGHLFGP